MYLYLHVSGYQNTHLFFIRLDISGAEAHFSVLPLWREQCGWWGTNGMVQYFCKVIVFCSGHALTFLSFTLFSFVSLLCTFTVLSPFVSLLLSGLPGKLVLVANQILSGMWSLIKQCDSWQHSLTFIPLSLIVHSFFKNH